MFLPLSLMDGANMNTTRKEIKFKYADTSKSPIKAFMNIKIRAQEFVMWRTKLSGVICIFYNGSLRYLEFFELFKKWYCSLVFFYSRSLAATCLFHCRTWRTRKRYLGRNSEQFSWEGENWKITLPSVPGDRATINFLHDRVIIA